MSPSKNQPIEIDSDLQTRLAALADRTGQSFAELTESVLRSHVDEQERVLDEYAEDERRWQKYLESGETVSVEAVRGKLQSLVSDAVRKIKRP